MGEVNCHSVEWYLDQPYPYVVVPDPEGGYVIRFPDLPGCMTQVETSEEIAPMADEIRALWLETAYDEGIAIPLPAGPAEYSGKFIVRVPRSLHRTLAESAEREGVSLNAYVTMLLARGVGDERAVNVPAKASTKRRRSMDVKVSASAIPDSESATA